MSRYTPSLRNDEISQRMTQAVASTLNQTPTAGGTTTMPVPRQPPPPVLAASPQFVAAAADCIDQTLPMDRRMSALLSLINLSAKFAVKCVCTMASLHMGEMNSQKIPPECRLHYLRSPDRSSFSGYGSSKIR